MVTIAENQESEIIFTLITKDNRVTEFSRYNTLGGKYFRRRQ